MAITTESLNPSTSGWIINATSADLSGAEIILAAPASGHLYLHRADIFCVSAINVTIGSGEDSSAVETPIIGPVTFTASSAHYSVEFDPPLKVDATTALTCDASGSGQTCIVVQGHTEL